MHRWACLLSSRLLFPLYNLLSPPKIEEFHIPPQASFSDRGVGGLAGTNPEVPPRGGRGSNPKNKGQKEFKGLRSDPRGPRLGPRGRFKNITNSFRRRDGKSGVAWRGGSAETQCPPPKGVVRGKHSRYVPLHSGGLLFIWICTPTAPCS